MIDVEVSIMALLLYLRTCISVLCIRHGGDDQDNGTISDIDYEYDLSERGSIFYDRDVERTYVTCLGFDGLHRSFIAYERTIEAVES